MLAKPVAAVVALGLIAGFAPAQPDPKKPDDKKLVTKVYSIKHLTGERGKASNLADTDAVVKLIFQMFPQLRALKAGPDGPQIIERDGGTLEIRTTADLHDQVKDLIAALERLQDLAIDVKVEVIELDPAAYEKLVKALPKSKARPPVLLAVGEEGEEEGFDLKAAEKAMAEANKALKAGRVVQTSSGRYVNGADAAVAARRTLVTFTNQPGGNPAKDENPLFVKEGFTLNALPVVSADRRFVRFKLTEQSTAVTGIRKRDLGEIGGVKVVMETLDTEDLGATGSAVVADGGTIIFKLAYAPKGKVWVVVMHPRIFIQAEKDELQKQENKK